jgi:hypothetical protein
MRIDPVHAAYTLWVGLLPRFTRDIRRENIILLNEEQEWTVPEWLANQGLDKYNTMNDFFMDITAGRQAKTIKRLSDRQLQMYHMAIYSLDDFRRFVFETSFLDKFDIAQDVLNRIKTEETELMAFACQWLKFSLFREKTLQLTVAKVR